MSYYDKPLPSEKDFEKMVFDLYGQMKEMPKKKFTCMAGKGFCEMVVETHGIAIFLGMVDFETILPVGTGLDYYKELKRIADEQRKEH